MSEPTEIKKNANTFSEMDDGLPTAAVKTDKFMKLKFSLVVGIVVAAGVFGTYKLGVFSLFTKPAAVEISSPPLPEITKILADDIRPAATPVVTAELLSVPIPPTEGVAVSSDDLSQIASDLAALKADFKSLTHHVKNIESSMVGRIDLHSKDVSHLFSRLSQQLNALESQSRDTERWLGGISNQLQDIGLNVKAANKDFPLVVFSKVSWGDDRYLTVAPKEQPDQTFFLRVGAVNGRWKLTGIHDDFATFEHVDGEKKEVVIQ